MRRPRRRLQRRLVVAFATYALVVAALFGFYAIIFMYTVEDAFFDAMLVQEVEAQKAARLATGAWATPRDTAMTLHEDSATFPEDLAARHAEEPRRREFDGRDGHHFHLAGITLPGATAPSAWIVAEVGDRLVVRPVRDRVFMLLALSALFVVVVALPVAVWLARRTTTPLGRLVARVDEATPDRLPRDLAQGFGDDEVGVLARGLDGLVARIDAFVAREQAFTRDAGHELRTPLALIVAACEARLAAPDTDAGSQATLREVHRAALQIGETLAMLLALAREVEPSPTTSLLAPVLERVVLEQAPLLGVRAVEVVVDVRDEARIALPAAVLHSVLGNLVGNAFAHTAEGEIRITTESNTLRIANPAPTAVLAERLDTARPFVKGEASHGLGLGLVIVKRLCAHHGLALHVEEGDGLATVVLPLANLPHGAHA